MYHDGRPNIMSFCSNIHQESEEFLSSLVVNKTIYAKVDRLAGIINFQRPKDPNDLLNDWSHKLNSLMSLVNKTTHLIAKEEMIHNLQWNKNKVHYFMFWFIFVFSLCGNVFEYTVYQWTLNAVLLQCHITGEKICSTYMIPQLCSFFFFYCQVNTRAPPFFAYLLSVTDRIIPPLFLQQSFLDYIVVFSLQFKNLAENL